MLLQSKMDELTEFLDKQHQDLIRFLGKWQRALREDLGLPRNANTAIGVSFDPGLSLSSLPHGEDVKPGFYKSADGLRVEVTSQESASRLVVMEMPNYVNPQERYQTMSPGIFLQLFKPAPSTVPSKSLELVDAEFQYHSDPALREQLIQWQKNFDWPVIHNQYAALFEKFVHLDRSLKNKDKDTSQMYFLECLFLFYILGNRLGYASEDHFRHVHEIVFSMVDPTREEALKTKAFYAKDQIETEYREIRFYDPRDVTKAPEKCYLTYSTKEHVYPNSPAIPKGCFLKASR